jgi:hypothetical protein
MGKRQAEIEMDGKCQSVKKSKPHDLEKSMSYFCEGLFTEVP